MGDIDSTLTAADQAGAARTRGQRPRRVVAVILVVLTGVLSLVSVLAGYVRGELLNTDRYVQIVGPLAQNPAVQAEVVEAVTAKVVDNVRLDDLPDNAIELLRARDGRLAQLLNRDRRAADALNAVLSSLGLMVQTQVETATRNVAERVVQSPRFAALWTEANRVAHQQTLAALRDEGSVLRTSDGTVRIDVGVVVEEVKQRLLQSGFALASRIPAVDTEIVLIESAQLAQAQQALLLFDQVAPWVPFLTLAVAVAAVLVAPSHRRGVLGVGAAVALAMIVLAIVLASGRSWMLGRVAATNVDPAAVSAIAEALLAPMWTRIWIVLAVAVVITVSAVLAGPVGSRLRERVAAIARRARS